MDIRERIIELLQIDEGSLDCDPCFCDDMHYRRLYVQTTGERDYRCSEHQRLAGVLRERLSQPPVSLSSPRIRDRSASPDGLILTEEEARQVVDILRDYETLLSHEKKIREIVVDLLLTWELARAAYRKGNRSEAAKVMNWTTGRRGKIIPEREVFFKYMRLTNGEKGQPKIKGAEAVKVIKEKYSIHSDAAVVQILKRVKAAYKHVGITFDALRLPNTWPKA